MTALATSPLPSRHAVRSLLERQIGRDVEVQDAQPVPPKASNVVAVYVTDRLATSALVVANLEAAARIGGAGARIPRGVVEEAITARTLPASLQTSCRAVLEVMAAVFNGPGAPRVKLYDMLGPNAPMPSDVAALSAAVGMRMDVTIEISGFGSGLLSVVCR
jgi:hypothetical protein